MLKTNIFQEPAMANSPSDQPQRIDINDKAACESWAHRLNVTHEKLRQAVGEVGDDASEVEKHLRQPRNPDRSTDGREDQ
jgi:Protein of unknown function (DUF3606)